MPTQPQVTLAARLTDAERGWDGVNMRADPDVLEPGVLAYAQNSRCEDHKPVTRKGVIKPVWCHQVFDSSTVTIRNYNGVTMEFYSAPTLDPAGLTLVGTLAHGASLAIAPAALLGAKYPGAGDPYPYPVPLGTDYRGRLTLRDWPFWWISEPAWARQLRPWYNAVGFGTFLDPDGCPWLLVATMGGVYRMTENNWPRQCALPAGCEITGPVVFVQAFNQVYLLRGKAQRPLVLTEPDTGFALAPADWAAGDYAAGALVAEGPWVTIASATTNGLTATIITSTAHGYIEGQEIVMAGITPAGYNGRHRVHVISGTSFSYSTRYLRTSGAGASMQCSSQYAFYEAQEAAAAGDVPGVSAKWQRVYNVLPNSSAGCFINNRLLLATAYTPDGGAHGAGSYYGKTDFLVATDAIEPLRFGFSNAFRINQGSDDEIVDVVKFTDDSAIVLKDRSWGILQNLAAVNTWGDLSAVTLDMRGKEYGLSARGAVCQAGTDVILLAGARGVVSLRQSESGKVQALDLPLSHEVEPVIERVNWEAADVARMAYWQNRLYVALPLDGAETNTGVLVFDFLTRRWAGLDTGPAAEVQEFVLASYAGMQRLYLLDTDGYLNLMEEADGGDQVADDTKVSGTSWTQIPTTWRTRLYFGDAQTWLRSADFLATLGTWNPTYSLRALWPEAGGARQLVSARTKSRTVYDRPWNAAAWVATNVNNDHATTGRQDYSVLLLDDLLAGTGGLNLGDGLVLDRLQETPEQLHATVRQARGVQLEISSTRGRVQLRGIKVSAARGRDRKGAV